MFIGYLIIDTCFAMVTALLVVYFLKFNLSVQVRNINLLIFTLSFGSINGIISTIWNELNISNELQFIKSILLLILSIFIIKLMLKASWSKSIISFCLVMIAVALGNFLAPIILKVNVQDAFSSAKMYLIVNALIYVIALIFVCLTNFVRIFSNIKNLKPVVFLLVITLICMAINFSVQYGDNFNIVSFVAVLISSLFFLFASIWCVLMYRNSELKIEEQKQQAFYNKSLSTALQDLRRFKHDQNNHLSVIYNMLKMGKSDNAFSYLEEIIVTSGSIANTSIFNIKNAGLFSIIYTKMDKANQLGVHFDLKTIGIIDSIDIIKISELCEVIGILLDNAIEAAYTTEEKNVSMLTICDDAGISITIKNSCSDVPVMSKLKVDGYSTKGSNRGHGLSIVEKILDNYKNIINIIRFDDIEMVFEQHIKIKKGL